MPLRAPRIHRKWPIRMGIVTLIAVVLLTYRLDIYRAALRLYRTHVQHIDPPRVRSMAERERIEHIVAFHHEKVFGIDVSHYQKTIDWNDVQFLHDSVPISFVICRSTMGSDKQDLQFKRNWKSAKKNGLVRGVYHYYRPNENSLKQAANFIKRVDLSSGDLPPILDIEALPDIQSMDALKSGLKKWLDKVEGHYGVKPIIYTGDHYFHSYLDNDTFRDYPIWIANYSRNEKPRIDEWLMWQFSDRGITSGIRTHVDLNVWNGSQEDLQSKLIP